MSEEEKKPPPTLQVLTEGFKHDFPKEVKILSKKEEDTLSKKEEDTLPKKD